MFIYIFVVGLTDLADDGNFIWGTDYAELDYTNWHEKEPNNSSGDEDCVCLSGYWAFQWNDIHCEQVRRYALCQKPS